MLFSGKRARPTSATHIGIASLGHNAGTTTVSIALANYLCSKRRKATAYLELGQSQIGSLAGRTIPTDIPQKKFFSASIKASGLMTMHLGKENPTFFRLLEVDYFPQVSLQGLSSLYTADYNFYILDLGVINPYTEAEFLRCDRKILLCDFAPWKQDLTSLLLQEMTQDRSLQKTITLLGRGGLNKSPLFSPAEYSYRILDFPHIPNPFQLTPEVFDFFEKLITGV